MQDGVNQEESERNEVVGMKKGADSTGKVMHCISKRAVGDCNEEDTDGRARLTMTTDEERILPED